MLGSLQKFDKQALCPSKAHEKMCTTNKYLLCVVLGRQDNEGKESLAHEDHTIRNSAII